MMAEAESESGGTSPETPPTTSTPALPSGPPSAPSSSSGDAAEGGAAESAETGGGRVKLYVLNAERSWDDKGTGYVEAEESKAEEAGALGLTLIVRSEGSAESFLLQSEVLADTAYQKQQETLIVWSEGENCDLALSFQEKAACDHIWEKICHVQGKDPSVEVTQDISYEDASDDNDQDTSASAGVSGASTGGGLNLPPVEVSRLGELLDTIVASLPSPMKRESLALGLESGKYIGHLVEAFRMCEDLDDLESLHTLYQITKNIFLLNKNALFEVLFSEDFLRDVIGMLEYEPGVAKAKSGFEQRTKHRDFLFTTAVFKEVIPIQNQELLAKIHQTFRVQYIQDVILPAPSIFEENMLSSLSSFVFFNKVEIVSIIQAMMRRSQNATRRRLGLPKLPGPPGSALDSDSEEEDWASDEEGKATKVALQTLRIARRYPEDQLEDLHHVPMAKKDEMFIRIKKDDLRRRTKRINTKKKAKDMRRKTLTGHNILTSMSRCVESGDTATRLAAVEILAMLVDYSPGLLREHVMEQAKAKVPDEQLLLNVMIKQLHDDPDPELASATQLVNILRITVDPENMVSQGGGPRAEKADFLGLFYRRCMEPLTRPLIGTPLPSLKARLMDTDDYHNAHKLNLIVEMLGFCMEHHTYNVRTFVVSKAILARVAVLLRSRHAFLALAALRFIRKVVQIKDEFYNRHIIKHDVFGSIVETFKANGSRYNLLNSAMLELFEYIRTENVKSLWTHFCANYLDEFRDVTYVKTFENLRIRWEQHLDAQGAALKSSPSHGARPGSAPTPPLGAGGWGKRGPDETAARADEEDEEAYFDEDEWDEDAAAASAKDEPPPKTPPKDDASALQRQTSFNGTPRPGAGRSVSPVDRLDDEDGFKPLKSKGDDDEEASVFSGASKARAKSPIEHAGVKISIKPITTAISVTPPPSNIEETKPSLPLVDYDYGDSDSEEDDTSSPTRAPPSSVPLAPSNRSLLSPPGVLTASGPSESSSGDWSSSSSSPPSSSMERKTPPPDPEEARDWEPRASTPPDLDPVADKRRSAVQPDPDAPDPTPPKRAKANSS